jgi:hypothetical protein
MTMSIKLKMILTLRPFKRAVIDPIFIVYRNSTYARKNVFFLVRVLLKARFLHS